MRQVAVTILHIQGACRQAQLEAVRQGSRALGLLGESGLGPKNNNNNKHYIAHTNENLMSGVSALLQMAHTNASG